MFGGGGSDELFGNEGADEFYTRDGWRDVIHCADSAWHARQEAAKGYEWGVAGNRDYVQRDSFDVVDSSCVCARIEPDDPSLPDC